MRECLSARIQGAGWDNVAWIGPSDIDLAQLCCPVQLWFGEDNLMASPAHGRWLRDHVPDGTLTVRPRERHLSTVDHLREILLTVGGRPGGRFAVGAVVATTGSGGSLAKPPGSIPHPGRSSLIR
jgi:hypothetical protein